MKPNFSTRNSLKNYDYQCCSLLSPPVIGAMLPWLEESYYGFDSVTDRERDLVDEVEQQIKDSLNISDGYIYFRSSGSAANQAVVGCFIDSVYATEIEHNSILSSNPAIIKIERNGKVNPETFIQEYVGKVGLNENTLVSVQLANQDTGIIQDIKAIADECHKHRVTLHVDACSAFGYMGIDMDELGIDILTLSSRKIGGPPGLGIVVSKKRLQIKRYLSENMNFPAIAGFGEAINQINLHKNNLENIRQWRDDLKFKLELSYNAFTVGVETLPNVLCIGFPGIQASQIAAHLRANHDIVIGIGGSDSPGTDSRVLEIMGYNLSQRNSVIRLSFCPWVSKREFDMLFILIGEIVKEKGGIRIG